MKDEMVEIAFGLICSAGEAKSLAMEAMALAREERYTVGARGKLKEANERLNSAHKFQTDLIQREASGEKIDINVLLIHSQDHFMNAMTIIQLAEEIVSLHEMLNQ